MVVRLLVGALLATALCACEAGPWQESCKPFDDIDENLLTRLDYGQGTQLFEDATVSSGTGYIHDLEGEIFHYESSVGGGVAMEDFDLDGDLDLIVTGGLDDNAYFLNQGDGTFWECAAPAGLDGSGDWSMGVSVADYDNDGDRDVLLLNHGPNQLLANQGDGSFVDVTDISGLEGAERSAGASWADLDNDGFLDLVIANQVNSMNLDGRNVYPPTASRLYRNLGNGTFSDHSSEVGTAGFREGSSYLAPLLDFDGDGLTDVLITQEFGQSMERNRIYQNQGTANPDKWITLQDRNEGSNIDYPYAVMGAAIFDFNHDTLPEIFMTNMIEEAPEREVLLMNNGDFQFEDVTDTYAINGMDADRDSEFYRSTSWAALQLDYDNDGDDDLYTVYGQMHQGVDTPFSCGSFAPMCPHQPNLLQRNDNNTTFEALGGTYSEDHGIGRGMAAGDVNRDGCLDLYIVNEDSPSRLLMGLCENAGNALVLNLEGTISNRDAVGSIVVIETEENSQTKFVTAGSTSVHSAQPFEIHIGIGSATTINRLSVIWPTGVQVSYENIEVGSGTPRFLIREGDEAPTPLP